MAVQQTIAEWSGTITSVVSLIILLFTIRQKLLKPVKSLWKITELLLWSRIQQEHDYFMRIGYCPATDKQRLCVLHKEYRDQNLNHLADDFEQDIIDLPCEPPKEISP